MGNDGDDCAAFFPEINGTKTGPISVNRGLKLRAVLNRGRTSYPTDSALEPRKVLALPLLQPASWRILPRLLLCRPESKRGRKYIPQWQPSSNEHSIGERRSGACLSIG